jgi:hypothetical protein
MSPNGLQAHSWVSRIEFIEGGKTINLYLYMSGFAVGTPVEISGYATQENGTIATFYKLWEMEPIPAGEDGVMMLVEDVPVGGTGKFMPKKPITVVTRATDAWITRLSTDDGKQQIPPEIIALRPASQGNILAWKSDEKARPSRSAWYVPQAAQKQTQAQGEYQTS